jgi:hypothetical protein
MTDWKALTARITLFSGPLVSGPLRPALDLFRQVWGDPDNFQSSPNPLMPSVAQGRRENFTVSTTVQPMRIDFNFNPPPPPSMSEEDVVPLALIEETNQLRAELERLIGFIRGFTGTKSVARVGLYLHFLALQPNIPEANKMLIGVMPERYRVGIVDEEDFIFQINRPAKSQNVEGVRANCLTKWSVDRFQVFNVAITMNAPVVDTRTMPSQQIRDFIASSVVFDFNNIPAQEALSGEQQSSFLLECLNKMKEMQREFGLKVEGF